MIRQYQDHTIQVARDPYVHGRYAVSVYSPTEAHLVTETGYTTAESADDAGAAWVDHYIEEAAAMTRIQNQKSEIQNG